LRPRHYGRWRSAHCGEISQRGLEWIGVGLGFAGVVILTWREFAANPLGVALILFATASWALGSVSMRRLDMPPGAMGNAAEMLAGELYCSLLDYFAASNMAMPTAMRCWHWPISRRSGRW
jgi:drug/metabolite transporter (DMT)-like permease